MKMDQNDQSSEDQYKKSGVNIDAGNDLVKRIKPLAKKTFVKGVLGSLGGFGGVFDPRAAGFKDPILVAATDGVGTKLKIAIETKILNTIGIDLVAMCVNDLVCQGAKPLFFLDYFATSKLDIDMAEVIIEGIAQGCKLAECALIGGETAEMPGLYEKDDFDVAGFALGAFERGQGLPKKIVEGDILLGLASSGIHSNGYSLVRKIVSDIGINWSAPCPFDKDLSFAEAFLTPTKIYVNSLGSLVNSGDCLGLSHITGGGITENITRILPKGLNAVVDLSSWELPQVFRWLILNSKLTKLDALRTFNCGIGMVIVVTEKNHTKVMAALSKQGETVFKIGEVTRGSQIKFLN